MTTETTTPLTEAELAGIEGRTRAREVKTRGCLCSDCEGNLPTLFAEANEDAGRLLADLRRAQKRIADLEAQIAISLPPIDEATNDKEIGW